MSALDADEFDQPRRRVVGVLLCDEHHTELADNERLTDVTAWQPSTVESQRYVDMVFSGPPGPEPPTLIDVEDERGRSIKYGQWVRREDGKWVLRVLRRGY